MKIGEFSDLFRNSGDQDKITLVKQHITEKYLPYERKMALCQNVIKGADYTPIVDAVDKRYYSPNTPMRFVFFCMSILDAYTDIECETIDENKKDILGGFNQLDKNSVFDVLFQELGREYKVLNTVLQMTVDDTYNKENNLVGYLTTKIDAIEALYNAALPIIEDRIIDFPKKEN
jgi:hypothetical protein